MKRDDLIVVRGGGDLATGVVHRLWSAGLRVLVLETSHPAAIRRQVSLCEAVYEGETAVEGMRGIRVETLADADAVWAQNAVPILIDPTGACLPQARPAVLVDAIIAKKNLGTTREMAPLTIALGPGFTAGQDVDVVVETKRGHKHSSTSMPTAFTLWMLCSAATSWAASSGKDLPRQTPACRASSAAMVLSVCSMRRPRASSATCILSLILWRRARLWPRSKHQTASVCR